MGVDSQHVAIMTLSNTTRNPPIILHAMANSLDKLVDDILIQIIQILSVQAVLSLRKTSRRYYLLSKLRCVWYARFCAEVLVRNLPLPGPPRPLSLLSTMDLEQRTLRALYLDHAWPHLSVNVLASKHPHDVGGRVDQVVFIPGGTELLTVQGDKVVHWLVVSGTSQGLKRVGEWTAFEGVPCRVVKYRDVPGVIAIGPRESLGSHRFAKVLSTSLKAPFMMLCDYARVPGIVAGVWKHLLLLDTTKEVGGGGLELLDWRAQATGTALLPGFPDLFGDFLDFVAFDGHLLVVWERCVSVFPIPDVPADGQVVVEPKRVFMFQEAICRPVGFTTCIVEPPHLNPNTGLDQCAGEDMDWNWNRNRKCQDYPMSTLCSLPTLTIAARSRRQAESVSMVMLIPLADKEDRKKGEVVHPTAFPYRLTYLPPHVPGMWRLGNEGGEGDLGDPVPRACTSLCLGSSGRGLFVVGRELRLVSPGLLFLPPYEMQFGPVFETGEALYRVDWRRRQQQRDLNSDENVDTIAWGDVEEEGASGDKVDFDEGMGRFVVVTGRGGFEVVELN